MEPVDFIAIALVFAFGIGLLLGIFLPMGWG